MSYDGSAYIGLNQDKTSIVKNFKGGYTIFRIDPLQRVFNNSDGNYSIMEMFSVSSLIAVVGSGENISYSTRHLWLLNLVDGSEIGRLTYSSSIICVKMTINRLIVALQDRIYIYNLSDMQLMTTIRDLHNEKGILAVSFNIENNILVYPLSTPVSVNSDDMSQAAGHPSNDVLKEANNTLDSQDLDRSSTPLAGDASVKQRFQKETGESDHAGDNLDQHNYNTTEITGDVAVVDLNTLQARLIIEAHKGQIRCLALSKDGTLVATASKLGTIIRVFNVSTGEPIAQFRRGRYPVKVKCLSFSEDNTYLAVSSSTHKVHVFSLKNVKISTNDNNDTVPSHIDVESLRQDDELLSSISELQDEEFVILSEGEESSNYPRNMKDILKSSSRAFSRGATKQFNKYFTNSSTSRLDPKRNVAYCSVPVDISMSSSLVVIGGSEQVNKADYPELFRYNKDQEGDQDLAIMRKIYLINNDGYIMVYLFDPYKSGECVLFTKLLLDTIE